MAYAVRDDVLARAGRFAGLFEVPGKRPNLADLDAFLEEVAAIIDAEIRAQGYDPATITADLKAALLDINAWAVVVRALPEASPGDDAIVATVEQGSAILEAAGFPSLASGGAVDVFAALQLLEAGGGGGGAGSSAGSFWDTMPDEDEIEGAREPEWERGQSL